MDAGCLSFVRCRNSNALVTDAGLGARDDNAITVNGENGAGLNRRRQVKDYREQLARHSGAMSM